ncbi:MAG: hypothetical protein PSX81_09330 [bacterium]|nr:hypothetical protein [bacterium]
MINLRTILEVITFILIVAGAIFIKSDLLSMILFVLWIPYLGFKLYAKWQYKTGKADCLLYPTINDSYFKTTSISFGIFILVGNGIAYWQFNDLGPYIVIFFFIGILLFFNGIFSWPGGVLIITQNTLHFSGMNKPINCFDIKSISLHKERIILRTLTNEMHRVSNVILNDISATDIRNYLIKNGMEESCILVNLVD